jgi:hypothetical protein
MRDSGPVGTKPGENILLPGIFSQNILRDLLSPTVYVICWYSVWPVNCVVPIVQSLSINRGDSCFENTLAELVL